MFEFLVITFGANFIESGMVSTAGGGGGIEGGDCDANSEISGLFN